MIRHKDYHLQFFEASKVKKQGKKERKYRPLTKHII